MLSKDDIEKYLSELNAILDSKDTSGEVIICGGTVMTYVFSAREATKDIDSAFAPAEVIRAAIDEVAGKHNLDGDWMNDAAKAFIDTTRMDFEVVKDYGNLVVKRPSDEAMLAMKLCSAREGTKDFDDALFLMGIVQPAEFDQVMDIIEDNMPPYARTPLAGFFAREVFQRYCEGSSEKQTIDSLGKSAVARAEERNRSLSAGKSNSIKKKRSY